MPVIEIKNLLFLLDCNGREILNNIFLVYAENQEMINVLKERNEMYIFYLNKTENRDSIQKDQVEKLIGVRLFNRLEQYTKRLIDTNKNLLEDCDDAKKKIDKFIKNY